MVVQTERRPADARTSVGPAILGVVGGEDVDVRRSGVGVVLARHDISISEGGSCFPVIAGSTVRVERGVTCGAVAGRQASVGRGGFVGFALAPKVAVEDGGTVLMTAKQAAAFGLGLGVVLFALVSRRSRRPDTIVA